MKTIFAKQVPRGTYSWDVAEESIPWVSTMVTKGIQ